MKLKGRGWEKGKGGGRVLAVGGDGLEDRRLAVFHSKCPTPYTNAQTTLESLRSEDFREIEAEL